MRLHIKDDLRIRLADETTAYHMPVPGSAVSVYLREGRIPDPYVSCNEAEVLKFLLTGR